MFIDLIRFRSDLGGTFGTLVLPGRGVLCTVERAWVGADRSGKAWKYGLDGESCIPAGQYRLQKAESPSFKRQMWYVVGEGVVIRSAPTNPVEWREGVMFHAANRPMELKGCIAPGEFYEPRGGFVGNSVKAMSVLTSWLDIVADPVLRIRNAY